MAASNGSSLLYKPEGSRRLMPASNRGLNKLGTQVFAPTDRLSAALEGRFRNRIVESIPFDGGAAGIANQLFDLISRHARICRRPRTVDDSLLDDRAVEIVCAEPQSDLRQSGRQSHPIGFDMWKIVEHQS